MYSAMQKIGEIGDTKVSVDKDESGVSRRRVFWFKLEDTAQ
ncbi:MAG: hypothetical protein XXXJIFNMEKO3_02067 [Candidatus Erwinia impunctatus]|nr:hypothetical protein XXXJIFNMEKO_02067 [Culicoides impunctatus]